VSGARPTRPRLFRDRAAWRAWLAEHHVTAREVWLVYFKKGVAKKSVAQPEAVEEALCYGWIDSIVRSIDAERYQQRFTPRSDRSVWSATNKRRVAALERQGKMTTAGRAKIAAAKQNGSWQRLDAVEIDAAVPPALDAALAADPAARAAFDALPPSHRKQYLWWIASAKRDETRARRVARSLELVRAGRRPGM
jgi:uncharacterized protein YdeI (YjbR/CyaY-like superfamily)